MKTLAFALFPSLLFALLVVAPVTAKPPTVIVEGVVSEIALNETTSYRAEGRSVVLQMMTSNAVVTIRNGDTATTVLVVGKRIDLLSQIELTKTARLICDLANHRERGIPEGRALILRRVE